MYLSYCCILSSPTEKPHSRAKNNLHQKQVSEYYWNRDSEINAVKKERETAKGQELKI